MTHAVPEARRRGRPPRINRERIVEAAFELGIENLTMAAVAGRLGVSHQSLYGWVRDRDELVDLMSDQLVGALESGLEGEATGWRLLLRALAEGLCRVAQQHRGFARAGLLRYRVGPGYLRLNQTIVDSLGTAGFEPLQSQQLYELVSTATLGWLAREEALDSLRADTALLGQEIDAAVAKGLAGQATATAATAVLSMPSDHRFRLFIEALLAGLNGPDVDVRMPKPDEQLDMREVPAATAPRA